MGVGILAAVVNGAAIPLLGFLLGSLINSFASDGIIESIKPTIIYFVIVGVSTLLLSTLQNACWAISGERQSHRIRVHYVRSLFRQELSWFELERSEEFSSRLSTQVNIIQKSISDQVSMLAMNCSLVLISVIVAFVRGWQLTFVSLLAVPIVTVSGYYFGKLVRESSMVSKEAYAEAGGKAE
jgi:ATP-binding cassette subfamily B (MDR/TAP) protein 1